MGGVITVNPATYLTARGWQNQAAAGLAGAATHVNDASDATWAQDVTPHPSLNTQLTVDLSDITTLPPGAAIKSVTPKMRVSQAVGAKALSIRAYLDAPGNGLPAYATPTGVIVPTSTIKDYAGASGPMIPSQLDYGVLQTETPDNYLDALKVDIQLSPVGRLAEDHRIYKIWAEVEYVEPPIADSLALVDPADVAITTRPPLMWDFISPDGYPQYEFQAAIWGLTEINTFPGGRAAFEADDYNIFGDQSGLSGAQGPGFTTDGGATYTRAKSWSVPVGGYGAGYVQSGDSSWVPQHDLPATGAMVAYVRVTAQFEGTRLANKDVFDSVDFTMGLTLPDAPTSAVAVWQYPKAAAGADRNTQYRTKITVAAPAASLGVFTGRRLFVEHSIDGQTDWKLLPMGAQEIGTAGGTFTFYDTLPLNGHTLRYRTRTEMWTSTRTLPSAYYTGNAVDCVIDEFLLRDPLVEDSTVVLRVQGDLEGRTGEALAQFRALGQPYPTFLSDSMLGFRFPMKILAHDDDTSAALHKLRISRATLLLQGDMTDWWFWVRIGEDTTHTIVRQSNRLNPAKRAQFHDLEFIQTFPISGQPAFWIA